MAKGKEIPLSDLEFFPPFGGFPRDGIDFMKRLKRNNNRLWFERHKEEYETLVKLPMQSLIAALQPHLEVFAPEFDIHPKKSLFRIYRDVRFSKDKTPYKTHVAAHFVLRGKPKGVEGSGFYLHIEPGEVFLGGGVYMPDGDQLKKIRKAIAGQPDRFLSVLEQKQFKTTFKRLQGEKLQRVPQGYEPDHPMAEWLKHKQFFVWVEWGEARSFREKFITDVAEVFEAATPLVRFLNEAMG
ncbi:MAG: DUF2461 domain-containing protein [Ignavibacteriales bacterium]|nr:DUF2461 domain-containing protein [Ignavibacteriales bacterium]